MSEYLITKNFGKGQIVPVRDIDYEFRPVELYLKEDGSVEDKPSIAIVMQDAGFRIIGQMSLKTLSDALMELGYQITKI